MLILTMTPFFCVCSTAIQVRVLTRETMGDWVKFTAVVSDVYKQGRYQIKRGNTLLWVALQDLACKCPKIRLNRQYLISSKDSKSAERTGFTLSRRSKVVPWRESNMNSRMQRFRQNFSSGRCSRGRSAASAKRYRSSPAYSPYHSE